MVASIVERLGPIDIAVLLVGAANVGAFGDADLTLNALSAVGAARALGESRIVPVHAEGWAHVTETRERLALIFDLAGIRERLHVPVLGQRFGLA